MKSIKYNLEIEPNMVHKLLATIATIICLIALLFVIWDTAMVFV